jgi:hypothetical protein
MKMELIVALLHDPGVLFLDEPTIGLDAAAQRQIRTFLREVNTQKGTTILLTSHYMEDVRSLCPRSVVINGGKKLYDGSTEELFAAYQTHKKITVTFDRETAFDAPPNAEILEQNPYKVTFMMPKAESSAARWAYIIGRVGEKGAVSGHIPGGGVSGGNARPCVPIFAAPPKMACRLHCARPKQTLGGQINHGLDTFHFRTPRADADHIAHRSRRRLRRCA